MSQKLRWPVFWALVAVFIFIACLLLISGLIEWMAGPVLFLLPFAVFFALGTTLIVLAVRDKSDSRLKKFLILTGASAAGILVSVLLHNLVYALFEYFGGPDFWNGGDELFFFTMAIIVCPLGFLVGAVGTIVIGARRLKASR